jgi:Uma2 family endonuclease
MVRTKPEPFTREDYRRMPEGLPIQLIAGSLVKESAPAPWHQWIVMRLVHAFSDVVGRDRVLCSPVDLTIDERNVYQPDVVVFAVPADRGPEQREIDVPLIVVEVLSESTAAYDVGIKSRRYLGRGVREVWLVDPDARTVEVRTRDGSVRFAGSECARSTVVEGFALALPDLFRF